MLEYNHKFLLRNKINFRRAWRVLKEKNSWAVLKRSLKFNKLRNCIQRSFKRNRIVLWGVFNNLRIQWGIITEFMHWENRSDFKCYKRNFKCRFYGTFQWLAQRIRTQFIDKIFIIIEIKSN